MRKYPLNPYWNGDLSFQITIQLIIFKFQGFSDASEKAYAAVLYIRISKGKSITTHLIAAKTRVAPIKSLSIP